MTESRAHLPDSPELRTSQILAELAQSDADENLSLGTLLTRFRARAFGVLLMLVLLPAFIPLPVGAGAVSGPLVSLIGLQMLLGLRQPWLPQRGLRRTIQRSTLQRFAQRMQRILGSLERACKPRQFWLIQHLAAHMFTGLQLILLGILLSLPIPLTNYPFALLILLYAITLVERDGTLLLLAWIIGCTTIASCIFLSGEVLSLVQSIWA